MSQIGFLSPPIWGALGISFPIRRALGWGLNTPFQRLHFRAEEAVPLICGQITRKHSFRTTSVPSAESFGALSIARSATAVRKYLAVRVARFRMWDGPPALQAQTIPCASRDGMRFGC